ncbi:MAG: hypothetical protein ACKVW3_03570 [Phycisphaerales bacterium]
MPRHLAVASALLFASLAQAQNPPESGTLPERSDIDTTWTIRFEPSVWYVAPSGRVLLPGSPGGTDSTRLESLNLDSPRLSPTGELHVRSESWRFGLLGTYFEINGRETLADEPGQIGGVPVNTGDALRSSLSFFSLEATASYVLPTPDWLAGKPGDRFRARGEVLGGLRLYDVDFDIDTLGGPVGGGGFFVEPLVGTRFTMDLFESVTIDFQATLSGFPGGSGREVYGFDLLVGFMYRPVENIGIQIGYRQQAFGLASGQDDEHFDWRGAMAGIYGGVVIRF